MNEYRFVFVNKKNPTMTIVRKVEEIFKSG